MNNNHRMTSHRLNTNYFELPIVHGQTNLEACISQSTRRRTTLLPEGVLAYWCNILTGSMALLHIIWKVFVLILLISDLIHHEQLGITFVSFISNPFLWTSMISIPINVSILMYNRKAGIVSKFIFLITVYVIAAFTFWFDILSYYNKACLWKHRYSF